MTPKRGPDEYDPKSLLAFREARNWLADARELLDLLKIDLKLSLPAFTLDDPSELVASEIRGLLGVTVEQQLGWRQSFYAVSDRWRSVLFDYGVLAMVFEMPFDDVRAFSVLAHDLACIGLNTADFGYGRVFSLFHDVAHLCLRQPGVSGRLGAAHPQGVRSTEENVERYCDRFAASFLLPADHPSVLEGLSAVGRDHSRDVIEHVAGSFKVSKYVVLRRAWELDYISADVHWALFRRWEAPRVAQPKRRGGPDPPTKKVSRVGKRVTSLIFEALDSQQITPYETSKLLGLDSRYLGRARELAMSGLRDAE